MDFFSDPNSHASNRPTPRTNRRSSTVTPGSGAFGADNTNAKRHQALAPNRSPKNNYTSKQHWFLNLYGMKGKNPRKVQHSNLPLKNFELPLGQFPNDQQYLDAYESIQAAV